MRSFITMTRLISPLDLRVPVGGLFPNEGKGRSSTWLLDHLLSSQLVTVLVPPDRLTFVLYGQTHSHATKSVHKHANLKSKILSFAAMVFWLGLINVQAQRMLGWCGRCFHFALLPAERRFLKPAHALIPPHTHKGLDGSLNKVQ